MDANGMTFENFDKEGDFQHMSLVIEANPKYNQGELWLGDYVAATELKDLRKHNIKTVLTCAVDLDVKYGHNIVHHVYEMLDSHKFDIYPFLQKTNNAIHGGLQRGNVLVHCSAGISRSASVVIGYLIQTKNWSFAQALNFVKSKRYIVCPNRGFVTQLKTFEKLLNKNKHTDHILQRITNTTKEIAESLQHEIEGKDKSSPKNIDFSVLGKEFYTQKKYLPSAMSHSNNNPNTNNNNATMEKRGSKYLTHGVSANLRKNSRAHSAKGFRLIDLIDLEHNFQANLHENSGTLNQQSLKQQQQQQDNNQNPLFPLQLNNINNVKSSNTMQMPNINRINLNKLTEVPTPPKVGKMNEQLNRLSKRSNSQQKLNDLTEKILKEEIDINYNKFEYKPRFKRISSAIENTNNKPTNRATAFQQKNENNKVTNNNNSNTNRIMKKPPLSSVKMQEEEQKKKNSDTPSSRRQYQSYGQSKKGHQKAVSFNENDFENEENSVDHGALMAEFQELEQQYLGAHKELDHSINQLRKRSSLNAGGAQNTLPPKPKFLQKKHRFQV